MHTHHLTSPRPGVVIAGTSPKRERPCGPAVRKRSASMVCTLSLHFHLQLRSPRSPLVSFAQLLHPVLQVCIIGMCREVRRLGLPISNQNMGYTSKAPPPQPGECRGKPIITCSWKARDVRNGVRYFPFPQLCSQISRSAKDNLTGLLPNPGS